MTGRLLQALGVSFVLALVGAAIVGLLVLKDRVRIVVAADEVAAGPDPVALLRDDVQTLARDVAALQQAVATNFEALANGVEQRATARHGDVLSVGRDLAAIRARVDALAQQSTAIEAQLHAVVAASAAATVPAVGAAAALEPAPTAQLSAAPAEPAPVATVPAAPAPAEPVTEPVPAPGVAKPATAGFLSFSVPTSTFRFDEPQQYTLLPELCRVGFDAKSTLHDFTGVTSRVRGGFRADFDDPQGAWTGEVAVAAATLKTGVDGRDENLREHLDTKTHTDIRFVVERFHPAADGGVDVGKQTARGEVAGTMTIRGASKPFRMPLRVEVDPQKRLVLSGQASLKLSDYGVPVPSQLGLVNMQDEVVVWVALRARAAAAVTK